MKDPIVNGRSVTITDHAFERMLQLWPYLAQLHERLGRPTAMLHRMMEESHRTPFPSFRAFFREEAHQNQGECWSSGFLAFILVPDDEMYALVTVEISDEGRDRLKRRGRTVEAVYAFIKRHEVSTSV